MQGAFEILSAVYPQDEPTLTKAFQSGEGVGWHQHSTCLFRGTERFFRSGYAAHLVQDVAARRWKGWDNIPKRTRCSSRRRRLRSRRNRPF